MIELMVSIPKRQPEPPTYHDSAGGHITILEPGDDQRPMRFRMVLPKGFGPPAAEYHPGQREHFRVLRGVLDLGTIAGQRVVLEAGDSYDLEPGVFHLPRNGGDGELEFEGTLTPGLRSAGLFESLYAADREHRGLGRFARVAVVMRRHLAEIRFALPIRAVMAVVASIARAVGVKAR